MNTPAGHQLLRSTQPPPDRAATFREVVRFVAVGMISSVGYALVFIVLAKGFGLHPQLANHLALLAAAVWSYYGHSRITFGYRGDRTSSAWKFATQIVVFYVLSGSGLFRRRTPGSRLDLGRGHLLHPNPRVELRRDEVVDVSHRPPPG